MGTRFRGWVRAGSFYGIRAAILYAVVLAALLSSSRNPVGYVARMGWFQAELLAGRVPLEQAATSRPYTEAQLANLRRVPRMKEFGRRIGLSTSTIYDSINPTWDRQIWNVSACHPLAFSSKRWWFPIVGSMPYIGFFREPDARTRGLALEAAGWDVYVRTAGAYSTLGWFSDPVLPGMLDWTEYGLANTVLHELTHATLWVRGSAQFNESFANVVGDRAALAYMIETYGEDSPEVAQIHTFEADAERYAEVMHGLYLDLDALYLDPAVDPGDKIVRKGALFATIPARIAAAGISHPERYARSVQRGGWNNARLVQFRTYNRNAEWFDVVLEREGGDLGRFVEAIRRITDGAADPWAALAAEVGVDPSIPDLGDG